MLRLQFPFSPKKTVNVIPEFINKPKGLDLNNDMLTVEPSKILLAGQKKCLTRLTA